MPVILKVEQRAQADFLVCVVEKRAEADLFVCEVENRAMARKPAYWFYTDSRPDASHSVAGGRTPTAAGSAAPHRRPGSGPATRATRARRSGARSC